jgi:chemotaxis protein methyltransferase CheR
MAKSSVADVSQYARLLANDDQTLDDLIVELTVGETYFFREPLQFDYIQRHILSEIHASRGPEHTIRMWSAACASGEEAYSLAILCEQQGLSEATDILATDISSEALAKARQATYSDWSLRGEGGSQAKEFLTLRDGQYHLQQQIRDRVRFEFLNLALDVYPSWITGTKARDLILCRNVLIYFDRDTVRAVAERLYDCLADRGWLILASGDPAIDNYAPYETVVTDAGVFYRKPSSQTVVTPRAHSWGLSANWTSSRNVAAASHPPRDDQRVESAGTPTDRSASGPSPSPLNEASEALARGDYARAIQLTADQSPDPAACVLRVKAMANIDTQEAEAECGRLAELHPLMAELHYLHGVLLMELHRDEEACQAVQRAVFLDRTLAIAHFLLGSIRQRRGQLEAAQRSFRNARNLCAALPDQEMVTLSDHETNGQLARAAEMHLGMIEAATGRRS